MSRPWSRQSIPHENHLHKNLNYIKEVQANVTDPILLLSLGWDPRRLLSQIFDIYLHLSCEEFAAAVAADERSFDKAFFEKVAVRISEMKLRSSIEIEQFRDLIVRAHEKYGKLTLESAIPYTVALCILNEQLTLIGAIPPHSGQSTN